MMRSIYSFYSSKYDLDDLEIHNALAQIFSTSKGQ